MRRWFVRLAALALVPALLVACGGDDDDDAEPTSEPPASASAATKPAETTTTAAASSPSAAATTATKAATSSSSRGKGAGCEVNITGDVNATLKTKDELGAAGVFHWFTDEAKKQIGNTGDAFFVLNCTESPTAGGAARKINLNFLAGNGSKEADIPMKAGKLVIAGGESLGEAKGGQIAVLFGLEDVLFRVSEPGTFNITKFDNERITAEFSFKAVELFTTGKAKTVTVTGKLDFTCEATRACKK
ncbi:MAG: hypothetical protein ACKVVT_07590 [Dehalococcoidia bacterium]